MYAHHVAQSDDMISMEDSEWGKTKQKKNTFFFKTICRK